MHYDRSKKNLYILNEICENGLFIDELAKKINEIAANELVVCDSEDPRSIAELRRQGVLAVPAKKGKDSVMYGIKWLKSQNIIIDVNCKNTINEFRKYRWKTDSFGNALPVPVDKENHLIDAVRYGCEQFMEYEPPVLQAVRVADVI
jgi:phage terminase large subunit